MLKCMAFREDQFYRHIGQRVLWVVLIVAHEYCEFSSVYKFFHEAPSVRCYHPFSFT